MKPGAKCLFTVLNGYAMVRRHKAEDVNQNNFDPLTLSEISDCVPTSDSPPISLRERAFVPTEIILLFKAAGLQVHHIWGGSAGDWGKRVIDLDEMEIMVIAQKGSTELR